MKKKKEKEKNEEGEKLVVEGKMNWFAEQEQKGKGTWLNGMSYENIIKNSFDWIPEMLTESGASCDSGGCHD